MAKKKAASKKKSTKVLKDGPATKSAEKVQEFEEASVPSSPRANRRTTRRHTAHVPGPRRKPKFKPSVAAAPAAKAKAPAKAKSAHVGSGKKYEDPVTFGSVDR
jgi:hypothetical protein